MFPDSASTINILSTSETSIKKSFLFDFDKGDFVTRDGKLVEVEGIAALKVDIEKALRTEKFKFKIYEKEDKRLEYGITIQDLIVGHNYPRAFVESEVKREVTDALLRKSVIQRLDNWNIEKDNPKAKIKFRVVLKSRASFDKEVSL
jgi:hypothetical protein